MKQLTLTEQQWQYCVTGRSRDHLSELQNHYLHYQVIDDFIALQNAALAAGLKLTIASSFRDFTRQSLIWNNKFNGHRPVYNQAQQQLQLSSLDDIQKCQAIMLYSALPGASRHHFGTDVDIFDANAVAEDYQLQLSPAEYAKNGPFQALSEWLDDNLEAFGFYRPYRKYQGGVAAEPWHISHISRSQLMLKKLSLTTLTKCISDSDIAGKQAILNHLPTLYQQFVMNLCPPLKS